MRFLKSLGPILAASARERLKQVPVRILLAGVVAWALHAAGLGGWIVPWLSLAAVVQLFEYLAMTPFRRAVPSDDPRLMGLALASTALMATAYGGVGLAIWSTNYPALVTLAALTLAGGLLTNVASGIGSRTVFFVGATPYLVVLALMPVVKIVQGDLQGVVVMSLASALFAGAIPVSYTHLRAHET